MVAPLCEHQAVAFKLADMQTEINAARHMVYHAARLKDQGKPFGTAASMAKYWASEVSVRASYEAIQIFGGNGYSREYPVERMYPRFQAEHNRRRHFRSAEDHHLARSVA